MTGDHRHRTGIRATLLRWKNDLANTEERQGY